MRVPAASLCLILGLPACLLAQEADQPSAPVRVLGAAPEPTAEMMPQQRAEPAEPPTIARGLLPQYQSATAFRANAAQAPSSDRPSLRFLLTMPDRLLVLEAFVTIDGRPFETKREQRIDRLLAELAKPAEAEAIAEEATDEPTPDAASSDEPATDGEESPESEDPTGEASEESDEAGDEGEEVELISLPSPALESRLRRYVTATGRLPSRDEVRWLLTKWVDGPTLLLLDENFQRFRATQAPAFQVLDRNLDGTVSADEVKLAQETLQKCDVNQNDVVEYTEIAEVADDPRHEERTVPPQALIPLLEATSVARSFRRLSAQAVDPASLQRFDSDGDGELSDAELAGLAQTEPDIVVTVAFDSQDASKSTTSITHVAASLVTDDESPRQVGAALTIDVGGTLLELSAVQSSALSGSDQVSIGIVNDGYPLLPAIDPNEDGRLTIRELRGVLDYLKRLDRNEDGDISPDELPATVRVSIGLGPTVHQHLADIRSVHPPSTAPTVAAPGWFTQMDRNRDGDISAREFLLGAKQFKKLDADADGLISPAEAVQAAPKNSENEKAKQDAKLETSSPQEEATASP